MKAGYLAVAAAMAVGVMASNHQAHGHAAFHNKERGLAPAPANCTCGSYTSWVTTYAEMTRMFLFYAPCYVLGYSRLPVSLMLTCQ
jgi:hypothetical protein